MRSFLQRLVPHTDRCPAVIVVSGLPRSGTSLMMQMLKAGGVMTLSDGLKRADHSNPLGYEELERVKELDKGDTAWIKDARGQAIKIVSYLLKYLPDTITYRVLFVRRNLHEVLASQAEMLARQGESPGPDDERMMQYFRQHLSGVDRLLASRRCFETLYVSYDQLVLDPSRESRRVDAFLGGGLDVGGMTSAVRPNLYRNRR